MQVEKNNTVDSEAEMTDLNDNGKSKSTSSEEGEECEEDDAVMKDHWATCRIYQQEVSHTSSSSPQSTNYGNSDASMGWIRLIRQ